MSEEKKQKNDEPEKNETKTIAVTVIITLLAVAVIGGLIFVGKKYSDREKELQGLKGQIENLQKSSKTAEGNISVTDEASGTEIPPSETTLTEDYSGWKTYANNEIGYTLKYPADWTITEIDEYSPLYDGIVKYVSIYTPGNKYFLHWGLKEKSAGFYISDRTGMGAGEEKEAGKINILGTEVAITNFMFKGKAKEIFYPTAGRFSTSDGKYEFVATLSLGSGSNWDTADLSSAPEKSLVEKILKSVTIIGRTASSSSCPQNFTNEETLNKADWKTVSNAKNGYSFKYPKEWSITTQQNDYLQMGNAANGEYFEWRSGPMTGTDFMSYKEDSQKNISVGCQNAKITYFSGDPTADPAGNSKDRLILIQFERKGIPHVIIFTYKYFGASVSSDLVEQLDLILKTVDFNK